MRDVRKRDVGGRTSGTQRKIQTKATMFKPAKRPKAPVAPKEDKILGKTVDRTAAQNKHVATAHPMPTSRWDRGNTSAE